MFQAVPHPGMTFFDDGRHRLIAWQDGFALLAGDTLENVTLSDAGPPRMRVIAYNAVERALLTGATSVFSAHGDIWMAFDDGRLCKADPGRVTCYGIKDGLNGERWFDVVAGDGGMVLARSASSVATFSPANGRWSVVPLPDQGERYHGYTWSLGLFRTPDGGFVTQADHGLAILGPQGWRALAVSDGAPSGTIVSAMTDATGQLWFQVFGQGLKRWIGYGRWETLQKQDGLSDGIAWRTARAPNGPLWISTDTGVDEVVHEGAALRTSRIYPGSSYALAAGPRGELWAGDADAGIVVIDPAKGKTARIGMPPVNTILPGSGNDIWVGTRSGLFKVDDHPGGQRQARLVGSVRTQVGDVADDGADGVYYLSSGRLRHHRRDDTDVLVLETWPTSGFQPVSLVADHSGRVWVGGGGGLFRLSLTADRVTSVMSVTADDLHSSSVVAAMIDHRGWLWAGTSHGVSVFDGQRWVSIDIDSGLVANDVDQGGLREDPDGSVWITTSEGVSHLLDPRWLFAERSLKAVVTGAVLGTQPVIGSMPYSEDALSVQFGTSSFNAERSVMFQYRLSGVDAKITNSDDGVVHYASVPPGHHVLTVTAYDPMTHETSAPASLTVDIALPWWKQWWARAIEAAGLIALVYGAMTLRFRAMHARQAELQRHVAKATEMLRYDGLTGLLNRREIEKRLAEKLSGGFTGTEIVVALIDVDHFKQVNDHCGHLGGDEVLRAIGRLILADIWSGECAGRYGGEEMLLMLDDSDGRGAERVAQLLHTIRSTPIYVAGRPIRVTCSIGLAWVAQGDDWEKLIGRADAALYEAKEAGRDQVVERGGRNWSPQPIGRVAGDASSLTGVSRTRASVG